MTQYIKSLTHFLLQSAVDPLSLTCLRTFEFRTSLGTSLLPSKCMQDTSVLSVRYAQNAFVIYLFYAHHLRLSLYYSKLNMNFKISIICKLSRMNLLYKYQYFIQFHPTSIHFLFNLSRSLGFHRGRGHKSESFELF